MVIASFDLYVSTRASWALLGHFGNLCSGRHDDLRQDLACHILSANGHRPWQRYVVLANVIISTLTGLFLFFAALFNCGNPSRYLENERKGICLTAQTIYVIQLAGCIINTTTDWIFAGLPVFMLVKASMPLPAKLGAAFILFLACCGSIASLVRTWYIEGLKSGSDFTNPDIDLCIWTIVECGLVVSAASAATFRPLFRGLMGTTRTAILQNGAACQCQASPGYSSDDTSASMSFPPPLMHEQRDLEGQEAVSQFSLWSLRPVSKKSHVRGSLGNTGIEVQESTERDCRDALDKIATTSEDFHGKTPCRSMASPMPEVRHESGKLQAKTSNHRTRRIPITRKQSVRDRGISPPIPHIVMSQVSPAITPMEMLQKPRLTPATTNSKPRVHVDGRRRGSPDWVQNGAHMADWMLATRHDPDI